MFSWTEMQDINAAQDAILQALSRTGVEANRFLVGDVKQSIYRFRLADPKIFRDYQELWKTDATAGTCVPLADNFRSREKILDFINPLIAALMRAPVGGVAYDAEAQLRFGDREGRPHLAADEAPRVELHLLSKTSAGGGEDDDEKESADLDATETEARVVARRLRALHDEGHLIWDEVEKNPGPSRGGTWWCCCGRRRRGWKVSRRSFIGRACRCRRRGRDFMRRSK